MTQDEAYINYSNINQSIKSAFDKDYYDKTSGEYAQLYAAHMPRNKQAAILDIGCGNGIFLHYLKQNGYENFFGIDADESSLDIVRKFVSSKVLNASAKEFLADKKGMYDLIIMNEVLEHIPKDEIIPLIALIHASLKPGGTYISYVPNMENPFTIYTRYHDFTHTIGFTQNSLRMVMHSGGFGQVEVYGTSPQAVKGLKKKLKRFLQQQVKKMLVLLFEYPANGFLTSMRIFAVSKKTGG